MNPSLIFFVNDKVWLLCHLIHSERKKLIDAHAFVLFSRKVDVFTHSNLNSGLHLHRKYLIRKWRMAHFVGCHQWVFFQLSRKRTQSQYTGEVTVNQQALTPM
jgi:hypothetical protein